MKGSIALLSGVLFGLGLAVSGMTNPANVLAFLTLGSSWQPALIFVMGSAFVVTFIGYRLAGRRAQPLFDEVFHAPSNTQLDRRLLGGAVLFGIGWGLSGFCPGPAIVSAWLVQPQAWIFLGAHLLGSYAYDWLFTPKVTLAPDG